MKSPPLSAYFFLLTLAVSLIAVLPTATSRIDASNFDAQYTRYCNSIVPQRPPIPSHTSADSNGRLVQFVGGYFSSGQNPQSSPNWRRTASFNPIVAYKTDSEDVIKLQASLVLTDPNVFSILGGSEKNRRRLRRFHVRGPRYPIRHDRAKFKLSGYWSKSSGKLCMVGSSSFYANHSFDAVLKLNYPTKLSINSSFVRGVLETFDRSGRVDHFGNVSMLALSSDGADYEYMLMEKMGGGGSFSGLDDDKVQDNLSVEKMGQGLCSILKWSSAFELEYGDACNGVSCNPLRSDVGFLPKSMRLVPIRCTEQGKLQLLLKFQNVSNAYYGYYHFNPSTTLIGEGEWDSNSNRWCAVACRILNFSESLTGAFAGDCSIRLCFRYPATFSIINRAPVLGQIWSNRTVKDFGYFNKIEIQGVGDALAGVRYKYGVMSNVTTSCPVKSGKLKRKTYPNPQSSDMRFDMSVKNSQGQIALGYSSPQFVGDYHYQSTLYFYGDHFVPMTNHTENVVQLDSSHGTLQNISYMMSFNPPASFMLGGTNISFKTVNIFAEGTYNTETGLLCMMGCRHVAQSDSRPYKNGSMDCDIQINIQFPPLKGKANQRVKGTIESMRAESDPLYFEQLELSSNSIYFTQATESIWRMDFEIVMVLVSNTLACVFVGLQLFHVKKQPEVLPFISITMLIVLTLGHMIPLLLNFEALFVANHNRQGVFLGSGGWLEVNEVIVRVVTMVAFLLELRLLHMTWSLRNGDANQGDLWVSEKKVLFVSLPLYIGGGLIAWFVHQWRNSHRSHFIRPGRVASMLENERIRYQQISLWQDLKLYAGLVLNGFLLPQILFNLFFDSSVKALSSYYYIGTTIVRLLPHAYDLYRAHSSASYLDLSYIYANHWMDFYSTAWDIIIPCGGLLFAILIYLQQRFSGRCILPKKFRATAAYEKVPTVGSVEL